MVGIVVAGHSRALASAAVALALEMAPGASITVAAGLDDETFGTDAVAISTAISSADDGDGVVVLMDLGSAVLSASMALEFVDDSLRSRVILCPAPLVEGLVAAAVTAFGGGSREEVAAEALGALSSKLGHFDSPSSAPVASSGAASSAAASSAAASSAASSAAASASAASSAAASASAASSAAGPSVVFRVDDPDGLHARPAARLVGLVRRFDAAVELRNRTIDSAWVPAASLSRVATLGVLRGHEIEARATGPQADEVLAAISKFQSPIYVRPTTSHPVGGIGGIGVGPAWRARPAPIAIPPSRPVKSLATAIGEVRGALEALHSEVFAAHLLLLDDEALLGEIRARTAAGDTEPKAWRAAVDKVAGEFSSLEDPYLRERAADVRAVGDQVLRALFDIPAATLDGEGVLVAEDLTPAEAAGLDGRRVAGVLLAAGSSTAHSAILLRTQSIPAIFGAGPEVLRIPEGTTVAFDGGTGEVVVDPAADVLDDFLARAKAQTERRAAAAIRAAEPAVTQDGIRVSVGVNIGATVDAAITDADLAGLVRTEFLFLDRDSAPDADEQEATYRAIAAALGGRPITLRTLDVGGDKPLPYLPQYREANPFLGVRGLRHSLVHPELLATQLLAIARTARDTPVNVMFPMVTSLSELLAARKLLDTALDQAGRPPIRVGIMAEVPAAILKAATFAPHADFVSIGTNDLTQYTLAAERGNAALAPLADALDPAVLRLIALTCSAFGDHVGVCGELAADELAVPLLLALGVRELSVAAPAVATIKAAVRAATMDAELAAHVLTLTDAASVRAVLTKGF